MMRYRRRGTFQDTAEEQLASAIRATAGVVPGYTYTKEDDEADSVFDQIDAKMKNRKRKKKKNEKVDDKSKRQKNESVHDQFKDLKAE